MTEDFSQDRDTASIWSKIPPSRPERAPIYEILILAVLFGWNLLANLVVPDLGALPVALSGAALLLVLARRAGLEWADLGRARRTVGAGGRWRFGDGLG